MSLTMRNARTTVDAKLSISVRAKSNVAEILHSEGQLGMDERKRVERAWLRLEAWLTKEAEPLAERLKPGATEHVLAQAEARLGHSLPEALRASYAIHNGGGFFLAFVEDELHTLENALARRDMMNSAGFGWHVPNVGAPVGPVKPLWWSEGWLPFVGTSGFLCVDFDPPEGGRVGQVIEYLKGHERRTVLFDSMAGWLEMWADTLESDKYWYDEDEERLVETAHPLKR